MKILTSAQMREVDRLTVERTGISNLDLMENAGTSVAAFLGDKFPDIARCRVLVLCGKGNNGGDGFVVARKLRDLGAKPSVILFEAIESVQGDAKTNLGRWRDSRGNLRSVRNAQGWAACRDDLERAGIIVDALLGTGLRGPVEGLLAQVIIDVNESHPRFVIAVDIPSGLSADSCEIPGPAISADYTISFTAPKMGMIALPASDLVGKLIVKSIGSPPGLVEELGNESLRWLEPGEFRNLPLKRKLNSHKGTYGHALIVAGSRGKNGAAILAGRGALRAGAGLVTVATAETEIWSVAVSVPELMSAPLKATDAGSISQRSYEGDCFARLLEGKNVLAMGPGLSTNDDTRNFVHRTVSTCPLPMILDADALNAYAGNDRELSRRQSKNCSVTPHPGEMARLLNRSTEEVQANRLEVAKRKASDWNAHVVLKGAGTILASPGGLAWINSTGNPGMATAGTGDALTGILAGLAAQFGAEHWEAALGFGVYLHGLAGDIAAAEKGEASLIASDLIEAIPNAFAQVMAEIEHE